MKKYRLYGKFDSDKKFRAFDINSGFMVNNLIKATIFNESDLPKVNELIELNSSHFPNLVFEIREIVEKVKKEKVKEEKKQYPNNLNDLFDYMVNEFSEKEILSMFKEVYADEIEQDIEEKVNNEIDEKLKEISEDEQKEGIVKIKVSNFNDRMKLDDFLYTTLYPNYSDQLTNLFLA